jgi:hypothetical protein
MSHDEEKIKSELKRYENTIAFQEFFKTDDGVKALEQIDILTGYNKQCLFNENPHKHAFNAGMYNVSVQIHAMLDKEIERKKK